MAIILGFIWCFPVEASIIVWHCNTETLTFHDNGKAVLQDKGYALEGTWSKEREDSWGTTRDVYTVQLVLTDFPQYSIIGWMVHFATGPLYFLAEESADGQKLYPQPNKRYCVYEKEN
jgi:hypothetical protein